MENSTTTPNLSDKDKLNMLIDAISSTGVKMNPKALAEKLGYKSHMSVYHVCNGRNKLTDDMIEKIILKMPEVNYLFLKKGVGKPLKNKSEANLQKNLLNLSNREVTLSDLAEMPKRLVYIETMLERLMAHLLPEELEELVNNETLIELNKKG